jgi:transposase
MTGTEFRDAIERTGLSRRQMAERWGVSHTTVNDETRKDEVRGLYRDAILRVLDEVEEE